MQAKRTIFKNVPQKTHLSKKAGHSKPKRNHWSESFSLYLLLAALRVILTCMPQSGYIHPDEYFQSIEIVAGDAFNVDFKKSWEFNHTQPIRSIIIPYITVGIPYQILKIIDINLSSYFQMSLNIPYFLLIFPRCFVCMSSFLVDFCLAKICKINKEQQIQKLIFLASSYVMFIYGTHTFSNTVEMVLLSLLLYLVADSQAYSRNIIAQNEYLSDRYKKSKAAVDKARFYKLRMLLPSHSLKHCIAISVITVTGVFNRPTFISFALSPMFFWFHRGLGCKSVRFSEFHCRMFLFLVCGAMIFSVYVLIDSFYYGQLSIAEIIHTDISLKNFVITPLNFIKYNLNVKNLAEHGLHPRYLHLLVNIPLLYNVLGIVAIGNIISIFYRLLMGRYTNLPYIHSTQGLMTASIIVPVAALSYFPHQEPRFLIPVTLPVVLLYSNLVIRRTFLYKLWIIFNILCLIFYGFIHQAGLYPATVHLSKEVRLSQQNMRQVHLVTSHVYNIPLSLFQQPNTQKVYYSGKTKYKVSKSLFLQEMGSYPLQAVAKHLSVIHQVTHQNNESHRKPNIYLLLPTSKKHEMNTVLTEHNMTATNVKIFYPHISTEAFPDLIHTLNLYYHDFSLFNFISNLISSCGLGLYQVHKKT